MLTDSEISRLKYETGFNLLTVGAEPYIGVTALFSQVIQPFLSEDGATLVRELLDKIANVREQMGDTGGEGMIKAVDEVSFYGGPNGETTFSALTKQLSFWRSELASVLGIQNGWTARAAQSTANY
jgi:hypothetical protein